MRANYTNLPKGIHETTEYLEAFLRNLLLDEKNELCNRNLHIEVDKEMKRKIEVKCEEWRGGNTMTANPILLQKKYAHCH